MFHFNSKKYSKAVLYCKTIYNFPSSIINFAFNTIVTVKLSVISPSFTNLYSSSKCNFRTSNSSVSSGSALDKDYNTWIVGQYRYPIDQYSWEIPEGGGKRDVPPIDSAKRELLEETGYAFTKFELVSTVYPNPATSNNVCYCYLATGGKKIAEQKLDENEEIKVELIPIDELVELLLQNKIEQALHTSCIFYALVKMGRLKIS